MGNINLKKRNICMLIAIVAVGLVFVYQRHGGNRPTWMGRVQIILGMSSTLPSCDQHLRWLSKDFTAPSSNRVGHESIKPIGILGPPGSGVLWLRYIIEQLTGIYIGSAEKFDEQIFKADGHITKVLAVMTHRVDQVPSMHSAIVLYRGMKDTVRSRFTELHGGSALLLEAPIKTYNDKKWKTFAVEESKKWAESYRSYLDSGCPVLVVKYEELDNHKLIQSQLLKFSNFFRVPVKHSTLECVMDRADSFPFKPRPMRYLFEPFSLLADDELLYLHNLENETESMIADARSVFRPKV